MRWFHFCLLIFGAGCVPRTGVENRAPVAVAGVEQSVFGGHRVFLNGTASSDPEGDPLTYAWSQTAGAAVTLIDAGAPLTQFSSPPVARATTLVFQLKVSDGQLSNRASTTVTLNVADPNNHVPVARIAPLARVQAGAQVELDGSGSTDSDGDSMTYAWTQTAGPPSTLGNADQARALLAVPPVLTADVSYGFSLVVSDRKGGQASTEVGFTAQRMTTHRPPVANAGANINAAGSAEVTLTGSAVDPDGDAITGYRWTQTAGPPVVLSSRAIAAPVFTAPQPVGPVTLGFSLVVTDSVGVDSAPARVNVIVSSGAVPKVAFTKVVSLHAVTRSSVVVFFLTDVPVAASVDCSDGVGAELTFAEVEPVTRHAIVLDHLNADTRYVYAVRAGTASASGSFTTAIDWAVAQRPFSFAVVGDARVHSVWKTVAASVLAKGPRFMIQTGDSNDSWGGADAWADYYASAPELFANVPVFAAQGNHDTGSNYSVYNLAPQSSSGSDLTFAFVYGNAAFVAIDTNGSSRAMTAWVSTALGRLRGGPLFTFHHHPLYSCGSHGSSTSLQTTYQRLFENNHVTTDFSGHDHALIVWEPVNGVRYVVSGGGGAGLYPLRDCLGPYAQSKYGFMIVDVDGQTVSQTLYDLHGAALYRSGPFSAFGPTFNSSVLGDLVAH